MNSMSNEIDATTGQGVPRLNRGAERMREETLRSEAAVNEVEQSLRESSTTGRRAKRWLAYLKQVLAERESAWVGMFNNEQVALWRLQCAQGSLNGAPPSGRAGSASFSSLLAESTDLRSRAVLCLAEALQIGTRIEGLSETARGEDVLSLLVRRRELLNAAVDAARQSEARETRALERDGDPAGPPLRLLTAETEISQAEPARVNPAGRAGRGEGLDRILTGFEASVAQVWEHFRSEYEAVVADAESRIARLEQLHEEQDAAMSSELASVRKEKDAALAQLAETRAQDAAKVEAHAREQRALEETLAKSKKEQDEVLSLVESALNRLRAEKAP